MKSARNTILKTLIALSKYLGCYEDFKLKMKNHGIKWKSQDSFESFLRIRRERRDALWLKYFIYGSIICFLFTF